IAMLRPLGAGNAIVLERNAADPQREPRGRAAAAVEIEIGQLQLGHGGLLVVMTLVTCKAQASIAAYLHIASAQLNLPPCVTNYRPAGRTARSRTRSSSSAIAGRFWCC